MTDPTSRTLRLIELLQRRRSWAGGELAEALGVSPRTLRRDVDRLRELGYPVQARRGVDGGYGIAPGASLPPLLVDDEEAVALAIGLRAAAQGVVAGMEGASLRALAKVIRVMPPRLRGRVDAIAAATTPLPPGDDVRIDPDHLVTVAQACRDQERLRFAYTARTGEETDREVDPHVLVPLGRRWYLVAWDTARHDWRTFRLDRLARPRPTGRRIVPREVPGGDPAEYVRASVSGIPRPHRVTAIVHRPAEAVRESVGRWVEVEDLGDGRCRIVASVEWLGWAALALGAAGGEITEVEPPELAAMLREWGGRFARVPGAPP